MEEIKIEQLRAGDMKAFERLYAEQYAMLCSFAQQILHSRADAEEVVNDVFLYLWEHRDTEITNLRGYLRRSVSNKSLDILRSADNRYLAPISTISSNQRLEFLQDLFSETDNPYDALFTQELQEALQKAIDEMPEKTRRVYQMSRQQRLSQKEIAAQLGITVDGVKYHIAQATRFLQEKLARYLLLWLAAHFMEY